MRMEYSSIVELDQLVLTPAMHGRDARADDRAPLPRRQSARERPVVQREGDDPAADEDAAQRDDRAFDFWKFGHRR